ncbi:MAG TPA: ATP-binding protein [Streptosporangiaceae bacterium]|nr:ATP-binding protein [Streptosporangiaceae bacterium]
MMTKTLARLGRPWRDSVRARIALACGGLFLAVGACLVVATYAWAGQFSGKVPANTILAAQRDTPLFRECVVAHSAGTLQQDPALARKCRLSFTSGAIAGTDAQQLSDRRSFLLYSLAGLGVTTVLAAGLGWAVARRVLHPLRVITQAAQHASEHNLDQRLALPGPPDELKELADTFDAMLARLHAAFASQHRFVANASHELRTPMTAMRALIDVAMAKPTRTTEQLESLTAKLRTILGQSETLIEALLTLAHSDSGLGRTEVVDLPTAVDDAVDLLGAAAAARHVTVTADLQPATVTGDRVLLERLVTNLVDNAVRYNVPGGWVQVTTRQQDGLARLSVTNSGEAVPEDRLPELFEPFRRSNGRVQSGEGVGLGLSIVQSVTVAHGGELHARPMADGGLEIQVTLKTTP